MQSKPLKARIHKKYENDIVKAIQHAASGEKKDEIVNLAAEVFVKVENERKKKVALKAE